MHGSEFCAHADVDFFVTAEPEVLITIKCALSEMESPADENIKTPAHELSEFLGHRLAIQSR